MMKRLLPATFVVGSLFWLPAQVSTVLAQDYIDVEAERRATQADDGRVYTRQGDTNSQIIRPYTGQTVLATPAQAAAPNATANAGDVVLQVQQLQAEIRRLTGLVEEQSYEIQRLKEQSLERYVDLDRRVAQVESGASVDAASVGPQVPLGPVALSQMPSTNASANEKASYQSAYSLVKNRQFEQAVDAFKGFLREYPFGQYAPNAHYWLGELYLVSTPPELEFARQSFKLLLDQYPDNAKVPDALYKLGRVHFLKGNASRAMEYFQRVLAEYGGHSAAQLAQDFLDDNY